MNKLFITDSSLIAEAEELSYFTKQFIIINQLHSDMTNYLRLDDKGLALVNHEFGTVYIGDMYAKIAPRLKKATAELLIQAIKLSKTTLQAISQCEDMHHLTDNIVVWDLTAGLGMDAALIASCGYKVTLVEQNPFLATLLYYAWCKNLLPKYNSSIVYANSIDFIVQTKVRPHVIYLDPMFKQQKSAKAKKNMQIIQSLTHNTALEENLFNACYAKALNKIVVKRDNKQSCLVKLPLPSYTKSGTTIRYDIYTAGKNL